MNYSGFSQKTPDYFFSFFFCCCMINNNNKTTKYECYEHTFFQIWLRLKIKPFKVSIIFEDLCPQTETSYLSKKICILKLSVIGVLFVVRFTAYLTIV